VSECEVIRRKLRDLESYLTRIKWDLEETEFAMRIDRLHGIERPSTKMHYEWLKRKKAEIEQEIRAMREQLSVCMQQGHGS
jgi:Arc/MetJ-type ribon-helix-helix transcriptional regulator